MRTTRPGYRWEHRNNCADECENCPWGENCTGRVNSWPHWIEVKVEETSHSPGAGLRKSGCS